ncbi:unnamed protein product, partial [Sphacelaria rigidula]
MSVTVQHRQNNQMTPLHGTAPHQNPRLYPPRPPYECRRTARPATLGASTLPHKLSLSSQLPPPYHPTISLASHMTGGPWRIHHGRRVHSPPGPDVGICAAESRGGRRYYS